MDFPAYVPEGARTHALHFLKHYEPILAQYEIELEGICEQIQYWRNSNQDKQDSQARLAKLRLRQREVTRWRDDYARDIENIRRLVLDNRMKDVYRILSDTFFGDEELERQRKFDGFIHAAWSARLDFSFYRERLKQTLELNEEIGKTAEKLANLLVKIGETGVECPGEFFSIRALLRNTDSHDQLWRGMRDFVLGERLRSYSSESDNAEYDRNQKVEIKMVPLEPGEKVDIDPDEQMRNTLQYAWGRAPGLPALINTICKAANEFIPKKSGLVGAALSSQKRNEKTEYIRAFGNLLLTEHKFNITTDIMRAMTIATNVVFNLADTDVTYDDVRKALSKVVTNGI